ncbi:electron transfer flavoprotein subunit alpha/FixB family protein [bacterium]|nr:electron transfer flavoprotein subunit alpha/FixB family protein [bacterium]
MSRGILLYAQITKSGYVHPVFFELASKAQELSKKLNNEPIIALIMTTKGNTEKFKEGFQKFGIDKVYALENERFENYISDYYITSAVNVIKQIDPSVILIGATCEGRDFAPGISTALHTGLTADCIELDINEKGQLAATRPTFGGQLMATILSKKTPQMATVRPNVFKPLEEDVVKDTEFVYPEVNLDGIEERVKILNFIKGIENERNKLLDAKIIIAGGMGMKNAKGFEMLEDAAKVIGAEVGATRAAVEAGIAKRNMQIGQTGVTVTPKIYIACGISGAIQHIVGMENSDKIFAVNIDKNAPIFEHCDCGIVGDVFEVLPEMVEFLKKINENI